MAEHHHSSESGEHRHHSKAYYKYRKRKHKVKKYIRKHKALFGVLAVLLVAVTTLIVVTNVQQHNVPKAHVSETANKQSSDYDTMSDFRFVTIRKPHLAVPEALKNEMTLEVQKPIYELYRDKNRDERLDIGVPLVLRYETASLPLDSELLSAEAILSDTADFAEAQHYPFTNGNSVSIYNLRTASHYYYRILLKYRNAGEISYQGELDVAMTPRLLNVDGAVNVRDIGGWPAQQGYVIRQGMLIRGSEIDGKQENNYLLTEAGLNTMRDELKIRFDADLRHSDDGIPKRSPIGDDIPHRVYGLIPYHLADAEGSDPAMRQVFSDLADESHYPMYLHCTYGFDRTGTVCYILEALLGVSEEHLRREYELSVLYFRNNDISAEDANFVQFEKGFRMLPGATMQQKAEKYLLSIGVTESEIESIRSILLEKN